MVSKLFKISTLLLVSFIGKAQTKNAISFLNPTGSYTLVSKTVKKNGETYGYFGEISIKLLDSARFAINFFVCKGAPSYNSGSFGDTLEYKNNKAIYKSNYDSSCMITFTFTSKGVQVVEETNDYNFGCGFGHAVIADGFYKKISSKVPKIQDPF